VAIYAIAIGLAGSLAMGVFQVQDGVALFQKTKFQSDNQR
jgi:hypothetical protein